MTIMCLFRFQSICRRETRIVCNLQVDVMGTVSNCSRNQARQIIRNFFTNYTPRCFEIVYKSGTYPMKYAVGNLDSGGNMFTVTILVKTNDTGNYIEQLKIEKQ